MREMRTPPTIAPTIILSSAGGVLLRAGWSTVSDLKVLDCGNDSWMFSLGGDPDINFCVWVLLRDGLHVHPFDAHQDGDGGLRAIGLSESNWREWLTATVITATRADPSAMRSGDDERIDFSQLMYGDEPPTPDEISQARRALLERTAAGRWPA